MAANFTVPISKDPFDPLNIAEELHDLILQHLTGNEVKAATEVSPFWNEVVGSSRAAMKKIEYPVNDCTSSDSKITRQYAKMTVRYDFYPDPNSSVLINAANKLCSLKFIKILPGMTVPATKFPNLKSLEIGEDVYHYSLQGFLKNLGRTRIEKLVVESGVSGLDTFLGCNNQLKELTLVSNFAIVNQPNMDYLCSYRLTKLRLGWQHGNLGDVATADLVKLIESQSATLTHFALRRPDMNILRAAMKVKGLKCIELEVFGIQDIADLPSNNSIGTARFFSRCTNDNLQALLALVPNLQTLYIPTLFDERQPVVIMKAGKNLRKVYTLGFIRFGAFARCEKIRNADWNNEIDIEEMNSFDEIFH